jgi:hypothetical protein
MVTVVMSNEVFKTAHFATAMQRYAMRSDPRKLLRRDRFVGRHRVTAIEVSSDLGLDGSLTELGPLRGFTQRSRDVDSRELFRSHEP